jgi:hypothetical protein
MLASGTCQAYAPLDADAARDRADRDVSEAEGPSPS